MPQQLSNDRLWWAPQDFSPVKFSAGSTKVQRERETERHRERQRETETEIETEKECVCV